MLLLISIGLSALLFILSCLFKLAGKARLMPPVLFTLLTATILNGWATAHETLALIILFILIAFAILSWLHSLWNYIQERRYYSAIRDDVRWQIDRAHARGISNAEFYIDPEGNLRYKATDKIIE